MKKLALFLALCLLVSSLVPAFADDEPVIEEPVVEELAGEQPASEEPVVEETKEEEPQTVEPVVEEPKEEEPATVEPVVEEPKEEPQTVEPVVEEPKEKEPETVEPVVEEPKEEEPETVEPVAEEPKEEEPVEGEAAEGEVAEGEAIGEETAVPEEEQVEDELAEDELSQGRVGDWWVEADGTLVQYYGQSDYPTIPTTWDGINITKLGNACFANNKSIKYISLPAAITTVGDGCFRDCTSLQNINFNNTITTIPDQCCKGCTSLTTVAWPVGLTKIGVQAFSGCTSLPGMPQQDSITEIGEDAFKNCTGLQYAHLSNALTKIGQCAFEGCTSLKEIGIPNSVTDLGNQAFKGCSSATKLVLSSGLTKINNYTFSGCSKITDIDIPATVTEVGREAFYGCSGATMIRLPQGLVTVGDNAFAGRSASSMMRWDDCQNKPPVNLGNNALGTSGYLLAPIDSAAHEYAKAHSGIKFISTQVKLFVLRCYHIILGRAGAIDSETNVDEAGLLYWCKGVVDGSQSGASLVKNFMNSQEFANQKNSNTVKVQKLYDGMLDRNGSYTTDEIAYWQKYLDIGMTTDYVVNGFSTSKEFKNLCDKYGMKPGTITLSNYRDKNYLLTAFVNRLYTKALERDYDVTGLEYWCKRIYTKNISVAGAATEFFLSKEFKNKVGSDINEFLRRCYRTFFDREPDAKGWDYWWARINSGYTYAQVCQGFATAKEWKNLCAKYGFK